MRSYCRGRLFAQEKKTNSHPKMAEEVMSLGSGGSTILPFVFDPYKVGPLPVINGVITPISRVITPVTHL